MDVLQAGWARRDITPTPGIHMGGYWGRQSGATGIHDPLYARLVAWSGAEGTAVLVSLDVVAVAAESVARIRQRVIAAMPGTRPEAVLVCCTHTHAGPLTLPFRGMGDVDLDYLNTICDAVDDCAREAASNLADARVGHSRTAVQIGVNRREERSGTVTLGRNSEGEVAPYAHVVTVNTAQGQAILFQHACHPVVLGSDNHAISADFPGVACAEIERRTGAFALYVNGAAGDINPRTSTRTFEDVDRLGRELGDAVSATAANAQSLTPSPIKALSRRLDLPLIPPPPAASAAFALARQMLKAAISSVGDEWERKVPMALLEWSRELLATARNPQPARTQPFEIQGVRIGDLTWLGMEGELFVRYQLDIEAAWDEPVVLCGYANGCVGYVPTREEYDRGGYEVDGAYKVYPSVLMIAPESDALVRGATAELLQELLRD